MSHAAKAVAALRTPQAVRERCTELLGLAEDGNLRHFLVKSKRLKDVSRFVCGTIRDNYPDLNIPFHSRWRHFSAGGLDRWQTLANSAGPIDEDKLARIRIDLAVTSVLLDAGAGDAWRYIEPNTTKVFSRSEGLAIASLDLFASGAFSSQSQSPLRADAAALEDFERTTLVQAFQVSADNPLVGIDGRVTLIKSLGRCLRQNPALFGSKSPRIGNLYDYLKGQSVGGVLPARRILDAVLVGLGAIWPGRVELGGVNLGDVWRHPMVRRDDETDGLVPFHKLSQWLTYSLVEPLEDAGTRVSGLQELTGLAEYRNGGLFIDLDVLVLRDPRAQAESHDVASELVVEWRALTIGLLDRLASLVRSEFGMDANALPLAKVLEGGTWSAGRRLAFERRPGGTPPIRVTSDGTVF
ncbi:MAG: DUF1688 family protein [Proteobacteria bacterium]|nr:MAG: DUF1688 family protein [Pseudomonadota bacterium]